MKDFYLEHICFHALLAHFGQERAQLSGSADALSETAILTLNKEHEHELQRASETVCGIATQMFDFLAAGDRALPEASGL
jgi:hypothetical protein